MPGVEIEVGLGGIDIKESFGLMEMVSILNMVLGTVQVDEI